MVRGARDVLLPLLRDVRALTTSTGALQYAPAVKSSSSGLSWLFGGSSRSTVPLSEPYPDVVIPKPDSPPAHPLSVQTSSLINGTKVASVDAVGPLAGVAVYVNAGSINETASTTGASFLISQLAFRATKHRTTFRLVRELDKIGGITSAKAGRDTSSLALKVNKLHVPEAVEIILDAALNPRYNSWEVKDSLPYVAAALREAMQQPSSLLLEMLHQTAFNGPLGRSLLPDIASVEKLTSASLLEYHAANFVPGKIALVAAGVELEKLSTLAQPLIGSSSTGIVPEGSKYVGGFANVLGTTSQAHVAIAFEAAGGKSSTKSAATAAVAAASLDANKQAVPYLEPAGGLLDNSQPLLALYKDTGLIGLLASSAPADSNKLIDAISAAFTKVAKGLSETDIQAARGKVLRSHAQVAITAGTLDNIGTQLLASGSYDATTFASSVAAVSAAEVSAYIAKALKSPPTVVTYGSLAEVPRYSEISKRFA